MARSPSELLQRRGVAVAPSEGLPPHARGPLRPMHNANSSSLFVLIRRGQVRYDIVFPWSKQSCVQNEKGARCRYCGQIMRENASNDVPSVAPELQWANPFPRIVARMIVDQVVNSRGKACGRLPNLLPSALHVTPLRQEISNSRQAARQFWNTHLKSSKWHGR